MEPEGCRVTPTQDETPQGSRARRPKPHSRDEPCRAPQRAYAFHWATPSTSQNLALMLGLPHPLPGVFLGLHSGADLVAIFHFVRQMGTGKGKQRSNGEKELSRFPRVS